MSKVYNENWYPLAHHSIYIYVASQMSPPFFSKSHPCPQDILQSHSSALHPTIRLLSTRQGQPVEEQSILDTLNCDYAIWGSVLWCWEDSVPQTCLRGRKVRVDVEERENGCIQRLWLGGIVVYGKWNCKPTWHFVGNRTLKVTYHMPRLCHPPLFEVRE